MPLMNSSIIAEEKNQWTSRQLLEITQIEIKRIK